MTISHSMVAHNKTPCILYCDSLLPVIHFILCVNVNGWCGVLCAAFFLAVVRVDLHDVCFYFPHHALFSAGCCMCTRDYCRLWDRNNKFRAYRMITMESEASPFYLHFDFGLMLLLAPSSSFMFRIYVPFPFSLPASRLKHQHHAVKYNVSGWFAE